MLFYKISCVYNISIGYVNAIFIKLVVFIIFHLDTLNAIFIKLVVFMTSQ
jgi:hypothetical protein